MRLKKCYNMDKIICGTLGENGGPPDKMTDNREKCEKFSVCAALLSPKRKSRLILSAAPKLKTNRRFPL